MKRIALSYFAVALASMIAAQTTQRSSGVLMKRPLSITTQLDVRMNGIGPSSSWIIGALIGESTVGGDVAVGAGVLPPIPDQTGTRLLSAFDNHDFVTGDGIVAVDGHGDSSKGYVMIFHVPRNTRIRCFVDGNRVSDVLVGSAPVMIKDGIQLDEPMKGLSTLLSRIQRLRLPSQPRLVKLPTGAYVASNEMLRDSVLTMHPLPTLAPPACKCSRNAGVYLKISEGGQVLSAEKKTGDDEVGDVIVKAARGWLFRPIAENGTPVPVEGLIVFRADAQGKVHVLW